MESHLRHLRYLEAQLAKAENGTPDFWKVKGQLEQVRIAYSQSWNLGVEMASNYAKDSGISGEQIKSKVDYFQSYFYDKLTEPLSQMINEVKKK